MDEDFVLVQQYIETFIKHTHEQLGVVDDLKKRIATSLENARKTQAKIDVLANEVDAQVREYIARSCLPKLIYICAVLVCVCVCVQRDKILEHRGEVLRYFKEKLGASVPVGISIRKHLEFLRMWMSVFLYA